MIISQIKNNSLNIFFFIFSTRTATTEYRQLRRQPTLITAAPAQTLTAALHCNHRSNRLLVHRHPTVNRPRQPSNCPRQIFTFVD